MRVGSVFSGIGGFDLGLERAGHEVIFQCEADPFRRAVLEARWPGVPVYEDVVRLRESAERAAADGVLPTTDDGWRQTGTGVPCGVDLLCGGFPCQDLSVAGRRAGLAGGRSGLFFEFALLADVLVGDGGWVLVENVPGLFSSPGRDRKGADFAVVLATLADLGFHDLAWRVLDSRFFGVPQRRRRVFILARRSRGRRACEVLLEPEGGDGDPEEGGEAQEEVAGTLGGGSGSRGWCSDTDRTTFIPTEPTDQSKALKNTSGGTSKGADHDTYVVAEGDDGGRVRRGGQPNADHPVREGVEQPRPTRGTPDLSGPITRRTGKGANTTIDDGALVAHTLTGEGHDASEDGTGRGTPLTVSDPHPDDPKRGRGGRNGQGESADDDLAFGGPAPDSDRVREAAGLPGRVDGDPVEEAPDGPQVSGFHPGATAGAGTIGYEEGVSPTLKAADSGTNRTPAIHSVHATQDPTSEEGFTPALGGGRTGNAFIGHNGRGADGDRCAIDPSPDGRRYAACGDAVSVPVIEWIGRRLPL